ncbi:hypothetical protein CLPU_5c00090 [Gottschalkia purinilytica]|uniref:Uncharacterized protein n=1 Tax=Gottschalkia purinilytica TaxID=1503 RepID=A0A0L0WB91_GOTPU|nr:hypothetical protein [Gottschalkia purinilytica]KNF08702.1 hypothetical protein CLPU_5c00090 [Gottschalkia purinilytica]
MKGFHRNNEEYYEEQVRDLEINDLILLKNKGLKDKEMAEELGIPKSYIDELLEQHRRDF